MGTVVALGGQVGGAKLAEGLYRLRGKDLAVIVNTGDDYEHVGLRFSPDLDTMLYTLAGIDNAKANWEPEGETQALYGMLRALGGPDRVPLGDKSLAVPLLRTEGLANDRRLTEITLDFCRHLGVAARILPMSDDRVCTNVITDRGAVSSHDYHTELACEPAVRDFQFGGADEARLSDEVLDALHASDLEAVVLCPCNPYHVIRPILEVNGMRELLKKQGAPVIAVSPMIAGRALRGSTGKIMSELGKEVSSRSVAIQFLKLIDGFVLDHTDAAQAADIASCGIEALVAPIIMREPADRETLARAVLDFAATLRARKALEAEA